MLINSHAKRVKRRAAANLFVGHVRLPANTEHSLLCTVIEDCQSLGEGVGKWPSLTTVQQNGLYTGLKNTDSGGITVMILCRFLRVLFSLSVGGWFEMEIFT